MPRPWRPAMAQPSATPRWRRSRTPASGGTDPALGRVGGVSPPPATRRCTALPLARPPPPYLQLAERRATLLQLLQPLLPTWCRSRAVMLLLSPLMPPVDLQAGAVLTPLEVAWLGLAGLGTPRRPPLRRGSTRREGAPRPSATSERRL